MKENRKAFLEMIAVSEIGNRLLFLSDNGYDVLVGGTTGAIGIGSGAGAGSIGIGSGAGAGSIVIQ